MTHDLKHWNRRADDKQRAEIERLTACLKTANTNHEHFERLWYLETDKTDKQRALIETLTAALEAITYMHDGNPPLPLADMPEIDYARRTISTIHREARAALKAAKEQSA